MKSKLTLRLDEDLKERAKQLADKRGTSVSKIVEHYFKLLLREDSSDAPSKEISSSGEGVSQVRTGQMETSQVLTNQVLRRWRRPFPRESRGSKRSSESPLPR